VAARRRRDPLSYDEQRVQLERAGEQLAHEWPVADYETHVAEDWPFLDCNAKEAEHVKAQSY
jgi:hypothetical protein